MEQSPPQAAWGRWVPLLTVATGAVAYGFHVLTPQVWDPSEVVWFVVLGLGWLAFGLAAVTGE